MGISFTLLAMMNIITGIFVESALKSADRSKDAAFISHVQQLFHMLEPDHNGQISKDEYLAQVDDPDLQAYMRDIGIDPQEARILFSYIDSDNSNSIDAEELISGLVRLRMGAKFMDVMTLMHELEQQRRCQITVIAMLEQLLYLEWV